MNAATSPREVTRVAVGVLVRDDGAVLLADRPAGKPYAGYWEFPGGKVEAEESVAVALERELHEELGIDIGASAPWVTIEYDYPHAYVRLYFRRVRRWRGEAHGREGQRFRFAHPAVDLPQPLLPAAVPAMRWLCLPEVVLVAADPSALPIAPAARPRIVVADCDWQSLDQVRTVARWRRSASVSGDLLLASGPGAQMVAGIDGTVLAANFLAMPTASDRRLAWRGVWVDSRGMRAAIPGERCDFLMECGEAPSDSDEDLDAAVPTFFRAAATADASSTAFLPCGHGVWVDLREAGNCPAD